MCQCPKLTIRTHRLVTGRTGIDRSIHPGGRYCGASIYTHLRSAANITNAAVSTRRATHQKIRRLFCPTSQARRAKIIYFPKDGNYDLTKLSRPDTEGRSANRHDTLGGMRWTRRRADDARRGGRSSCVVVVPRRWDQACRAIRRATEANKPGTPARARSKP
jgi:hypothetical protein